MNKIVFVEDDPEVGTLIAAYLGKHDMDVVVEPRGDRAEEVIAREKPDLVLLDNGCGTGETFDWSLAGGVTRPFLLAGGLTPENIPAAVAALHPYGLDLSSGVETEKKKDRHKIEAAGAAARKE